MPFESNSFQLDGSIIDPENGRCFSGKITVRDGIIREIKESEAVSSRIIAPAFVDSHVHVESSLLAPSEFARLSVLHGTCAAVADPHEIANVCGIAGVDFMIRNGKSSPFKFFFGASPCVPATIFETAGGTITSAEIEALLSRPDVFFLAEVMNFPGVIAGDEELQKKISCAKRAGKQIDGHAPGLRGEDLRRYVAAGISTDHECIALDEALEKIGLGMKISIREGSAAKNFDALAELVKLYPWATMFCTDDVHPDSLAKSHIDNHIRRALKHGAGVMDCLRTATVNPVRHYGLTVGLMHPGDPADLVVVNNLDEFQILSTFIDGTHVAEKGQPLIAHRKVDVINNFHCSDVTVSSLAVKTECAYVRAIGVSPGQLITEKFHVPVKVQPDGNVAFGKGTELLKLLVKDRYNDKPAAVGFVKGFQLPSGAIASSVSHDSHNIIAIGNSDEELAAAANLVVSAQGGLSYVDFRREISSILKLPIAGLMSGEPAEVVVDRYVDLQRAIVPEGSPSYGYAPFMMLSFLALLVIPKLKLSDQGLFDGETFKFIPLFCDEES